MPSSFIKDANPPPIRYRTPSPPIHAFERLSPALYEKTPAEALGFGLWWANNNETSNGRKRHHISEEKDGNDALGDYRPSCGTMDALASIALATKPNGLYTSRTSIDGLRNKGSHNGEPPAKRARSEKLPSSDWQRKIKAVDNRPATSYEQLPESRRLEAELLVNFAQEAAKLTTPSPVLSKAITNHLRRPSELPMLPPPAPAIAHTSDGRPDDVEDSRPRDIEDVQGPPFSPLSNAAMDDEPNASEGGSGHDEDAVRSDTPNNLLNPQIDTPTHLHVMSNAEPLDSSELGDQQPGVSHAEPELDVNHEYGSGLEKTDDQKPGEVLLLDNNVEAEDYQTLEKRTWVDNDTKLKADAAPPLVDTAQTREDNALQEMENNSLKMVEDPLQPQTAGQVRNDHILVDEGLEGQPPDDVQENESRVMHGPMGSSFKAVTKFPTLHSTDADELAPDPDTTGVDNSDTQTADAQASPAMATAVCAACNFARNSVAIEKDDNSTSWISCDACKDWFHFACAGFKNEREVRSVDKFRCRKCKPIHGATTYVRKSSRAHIPIDYAGLHQGVIKTSDESPEHHYIKPIKDGTITFLPENFARMRPELVTAEFFEKGIGMKEPVVIPACFNPQPRNCDSLDDGDAHISNETRPNPLDDSKIAEEWFARHEQSDMIPDQGQDALDMVIPQGLTVRKVCELYGPEEKVEVIDVKSQNGENRKWNMRRWADYYENPNNKVVRNVISLEVSQSKLGRLIRRPKIVRDLDLQDSVWPQDLLAKGEYPRVQFYCLMSVADCFTDFHIDFGGSSVFYHILKGKKTFLFIPPKEKHLKKYEEWCMSPAQNWTFLGDQTKECYRVDLSEGDTMLIPAGWIHAVWTPEDSLVIGGNFLTRMNFAMQLRVAEVEKATGVARKFRYPSFQKLQWYTALRYLEDDALPTHVRDLLHSGGTFHRERSTYLDFDAWGENSRPGSENYHAKYYSQSELEGLPNLVRYLLRTALIDIGSITDGISTDTRNAVKKAIPRAHGHGEPLDVVKTFAAWVAWKRGDEPIPHWAYPDAVPETLAPDKLSAAATKKLDREAALSAPRRQSARMQSQQQASEKQASSQEVGSVPNPASNSTELSTPVGAKRPFPDPSVHGDIDSTLFDTSKRPRTAETSSSHRKTACESCRKRRRACKHKDQVAANVPEPAVNVASSNTTPAMRSSNMAVPETPSRSQPLDNELVHSPEDFAARLKTLPQDVLAGFPKPEQRATVNAFTKLGPPIVIPPGRPRTKACNECRKSKRRCVHDIFGNEDPIKLREVAIPRPHARKSKETGKKPATSSNEGSTTSNIGREDTATDVPAPGEQVRMVAPVANMIASPPILDTQGSTASSLPAASSQASAELALDPELFRSNPYEVSADTHRTDSIDVERPSGGEMDNSGSLRGAKVDMITLEPRESYEQPASSLVSPPASTSDDAGHSPPAGNETWTPSISSSRQSSRQPKQIHLQQRNTPESGLVRRASTSSYGENTAQKEVDSGISPRVTEPSSSDHQTSHQRSGAEANVEPSVFHSQFRRHSLGQHAQVPNVSLNLRGSAPPTQHPKSSPVVKSPSVNERLTQEDEESLKLIKELQAQDYGLRRRGVGMA